MVPLPAKFDEKLILKAFATPDIPGWGFNFVFLGCLTVEAVSGRCMLAALFVRIKRVWFDCHFLDYIHQQASLPSLKFRNGSWEPRSLPCAYKMLDNGLAGERIIKSYSGKLLTKRYVLIT